MAKQTSLLDKAGIQLPSVPTSIASGGVNIEGESILFSNDKGEQFALLLYSVESINESADNTSKSGKSFVFKHTSPSTNLSINGRKLAFTNNGYLVKPKEK